MGVARGNSVRAKHIGKDIMAGLKHLVGGEIMPYSEVISQSRDKAFDRLEYYCDATLDGLMPDSNLNSVLTKNMSKLLEIEIKKYPKIFATQISTFYKEICSKYNISIERYRYCLLEKAYYEMFKLIDIILEKLK